MSNTTTVSWDYVRKYEDMRAEIERLREDYSTAAVALRRAIDDKLYAAAEIERLQAFLHRISGANDNPSCFNANVEAVLNEWRALEGK
jgi:hypothetical protein